MRGVKRARLRNHSFAVITKGLILATGQYNTCAQRLEFAFHREIRARTKSVYCRVEDKVENRNFCQRIESYKLKKLSCRKWVALGGFDVVNFILENVKNMKCNEILFSLKK